MKNKILNTLHVILGIVGVGGGGSQVHNDLIGLVDFNTFTSPVGW